MHIYTIVRISMMRTRETFDEIRNLGATENTESHELRNDLELRMRVFSWTLRFSCDFALVNQELRVMICDCGTDAGQSLVNRTYRGAISECVSC